MTRFALIALGLGVLPLVHSIEGDNDLLQPAPLILVLLGLCTWSCISAPTWRSSAPDWP